MANDGFDGHDYERVRGRVARRTDRKQLQQRTKESDRVGKFTSIPGNHRDGNNGDGHVASDKDLEMNFPAIWEFLSLSSDGGKRRETSTLLVFVQDGQVLVCLNDRQEGRSTFQGAPTLREAMVALEERLSLGGVEWRYRRDGVSGSRRKLS
jgi:hypothetical protein